jgi:hypothetical protein
MNGELSEDTKLMLLHTELVDPVLSCISRFYMETGKMPKVLLVSMEVWNSIGRARQFEGLLVICDSKLKGKSIYCTMEEMHNS